MLLKRCLIYAALLLAFTRHELLAKGAQIVVHLKDGRQMAGELHSVSDSSLVISRREASAEHISQVSTKEIRQVVIKNKPQVVLQLKNGRQMKGKLHSVSDSSVTILVRGSVSALAFKNEVRNQEIQGVLIKGKSNIGKGIGLGILIGAGTGAVIGFADGDDPPCEPLEVLLTVGTCEAFRMTAEQKAAWVGILGGAAGLAVGGIAGAATSTSSKEIELSDDQPFLVLKPLARYAERRPEDKW
ncbi:hypothetical protein L0337_15370 [candidate division KSB1 bacterium]|nr:hypothetical protein [candidate division KSB1 bacterium]